MTLTQSRHFEQKEKSSIANIVTTGTFTIPLMKKVGYPPTKTAAIEVAASTDGKLAPPIMGAAAFIIAEYVNVPYIEVVKAAAVPAFASYAARAYCRLVGRALRTALLDVPHRPGGLWDSLSSAAFQKH